VASVVSVTGDVVADVLAFVDPALLGSDCGCEVGYCVAPVIPNSPTTALSELRTVGTIPVSSGFAFFESTGGVFGVVVRVECHLEFHDALGLWGVVVHATRGGQRWDGRPLDDLEVVSRVVATGIGGDLAPRPVAAVREVMAAEFLSHICPIAVGVASRHQGRAGQERDVRAGRGK